MNTLCHLEFEVLDLDDAQRFFGGLFPNWTFRDYEGMNMRVFGIGDQHIGGLMKVEAVQPSATPSLWFQVEDLDWTTQRAVELGGTVLSAKSPVPGVGFSAQVCDPLGNRIGLVQYG